MNILAFLMPLALALGLLGLAAFFWCMGRRQFEDLDGAGWRVLSNDDLAPSPPMMEPKGKQQ
jgi:cbb3-type cytochrome oxidase maturation protein